MTSIEYDQWHAAVNTEQIFPKIAAFGNKTSLLLMLRLCKSRSNGFKPSRVNNQNPTKVTSSLQLHFRIALFDLDWKPNDSFEYMPTGLCRD